jgi:serine protease Do
MAKQNLYALLGVDQDAGNAALEAAYRDACAILLARPDVHESDVQNRLKFLKFAHETLLHPARRATHDASLIKPAAPALAARSAARPRSLALPLIGAAVLAAIALAAWKARPGQAAPAPLAAAPATIPAQADPALAAVASERLAPELLFQRNSQSVVVVIGLNGASNEILQGSGVVVGDERVITNCHVAKSAASTVIKLAGKRYPATLLRFDDNPQHDLCLLAVENLHAPAMPLAAVESIKVGHKAYALGAPHGLDLTLSEGIVSSLRKQDDSHYIQTTASISPGSSGGGLFNDSGALIGITTFQAEEGQNLNFAVPVDWVKQLVEKNESLAMLGAEAFDDLRGKWQCATSKGKAKMLFTFTANGGFRLKRPGDSKDWFGGNYSIMGNHTLVLSSEETSPPEFYIQVIALSKHELRISSLFYQDPNNYSCLRTGF